jgi:hypothetical protein
MTNLKFIIDMILLFNLFGRGQSTNSKGKITVPVVNVTPTVEQQERRNQSEAYCKYHNVPVYSNPNSLFVDSDENISIRTKDEVVDRVFALCFIGIKSEGLEQQHIEKLAEDWTIFSKLSPKETMYVKAEQPTEQQTVDANWRYESLHVMLWALGYIDTLAYPSEMCDVASDVKFIFQLSEESFREKSQLRSKKEILDQADLILRLHWACVSARIKNQEAPSNLNQSVVYERHYSLNWLINDIQADWDDVQTNT